VPMQGGLAVAIPSMHSGGMLDSRVQVLDSTLVLSLIERARQSPRLRTNHNFHSSLEDNPHRFLNLMIRGTYITPHRHRDPPKCESFLVLEGELAFFTWDDAGQIASTFWGAIHSESISSPASGILLRFLAPMLSVSK